MKPCPVRREHEWDGDWCRACYCARETVLRDAEAERRWHAWAEGFLSRPCWVGLVKSIAGFPCEPPAAFNYRRAVVVAGAWVLSFPRDGGVIVSNRDRIEFGPPTEDWGAIVSIALFDGPLRTANGIRSCPVTGSPKHVPVGVPCGLDPGALTIEEGP